ncbi:MAG: hypothetical protein L7S63_04705, partial [Flavobacteriales bacterium]|nr:hypothetical protein [Flavobacteriales bacterium]
MKPILSQLLACLALVTGTVTVHAQTIGGCSIFDAGPNETWQYVLTVTTPDSASSADMQTIV